MRQAFHIFRKDVLHCWPYIAAVMALTAVNVWQASHDTLNSRGQLDTDSVPVAFLIGLSWWLAIRAAVHGESPVGECQFWITRPYSWKSLVAAKLLFVAAFLALPVLLSDCVILHASGFHPLSPISGLLQRQWLLLTCLVLPFLLAALTRPTRDFLFAAVLFYTGCYFSLFFSGFWVASGAGANLGAVSRVWHAAPSVAPVAGLSLAAWRYARRHSALVRVIAIALGALATTWTTSPVPYALAPAGSIPNAGDPRFRSVAIQLAGDPEYPSDNLIRVPVRFTGWPRNLMNCQLTRVTLSQRERGSEWFEPNPSFTINTNLEGPDWIQFPVGKNPFTIHSPGLEEAEVRLAFDLRLYERLGAMHLPSSGAWMDVPGFGTIRVIEDDYVGHLIGRTPLKLDEREWVFSLSSTLLGASADGDWPLRSYSGIDIPFTFQISPVHSYQVNVAPRSPPVIVTAKRMAAKFHFSLEIPKVRLADYETKYP